MLAVIGGGQLARMMAQPAVALGLPLRLLAEAEGVSAAQVIPDHVVGDYRDLDGCGPRRRLRGGDLRPRARAHRAPARAGRRRASRSVPGPDALVHAQDKAVMRARLTELGVPCPRHRAVTSPAEVAAFGFPAVLKTTRGGYDGKGVWVVRPPPSASRPSRPPRRRASRSWPRSWSTSGASCPRWWRGRRAARRRRTRSWPAPRPTASAGRSSPRRPTSTPRWPGRRRRSRCGSPVRST